MRVGLAGPLALGLVAACGSPTQDVDATMRVISTTAAVEALTPREPYSTPTPSETPTPAETPTRVACVSEGIVEAALVTAREQSTLVPGAFETAVAVVTGRPIPYCLTATATAAAARP